jgi:flagellar hook-basal body complex protein FliE
MTNPLDNVLRVDLDKAGLAPNLNPAAPAAEQGEMPFKDILKNLVDKVASLQKDADVSLQGLVTGETTDIHNVAIKMEEAGVAFDLMMEVRNKLLEAYQEISKMQP